MIGFHHSNRLLAKQGRPKRKKKFLWPFVVLGLLLFNIYLFAFRGLPGDAEPVRTPRTLSKMPVFSARSFGEMQGVSGQRVESQSMVPFRSTKISFQRYELESANGIAGQRSLDQWATRLRGRILPSEGFSVALNRIGLRLSQVQVLVEALNPIFDFRQCREGDEFQVLVSPKGLAYRFRYQKSPEVSFVAGLENGQIKAHKVIAETQIKVVPIATRIEGSLWQSLAHSAQTGSLVMMMVDIFAWDIDFYSDTQPGDSIRLLVEEQRVNGAFVRYGRILAAEYSNTSWTRRAFYYDNNEKTRGYYDEDGGSLRKAFLKSPLKFSRVTSSYGMRVHPVLGFNKMHQGVDFSAPVGTPIWAPADGTVVVAGRRGASGIMLKLRHANGYETVYAHLSRINNLRPGVRVCQKQVIAFTGNTGRSTGPHLHYGMKIRSKHVNPLGQRFPPAKPIPQDELQSYKQSMVELLQKMESMTLRVGGSTASVASAKRDAG
jgi:murein DD-endopeptidase MepM/ murein hydrolase activator NlpD